MKRLFRKIPYKHRIAIVILLFALLPGAFAEKIYLQNVQEKWKQEALLEYQSDVDSCALVMSHNVNNLLSKMEYVRNNHAVRSTISHIDKLSLAQSLDLISELDNVVSSIATDSQSLEIRWYPHRSKLSYGSYCHTLDTLASEFPFGKNDSVFQRILMLEEGKFLWQVKDISRDPQYPENLETRLCLYTQIQNMNGSDFVLEFSIPVSQILENRKSTPMDGGLFAICLRNSSEPVDIILDSAFPTEETQDLMKQYHRIKILPNYTILRSHIPNVPNSEVIYMIPASYIKSVIQPQIFAFVIVSLLFLMVIVGTSYLTAHLLTKRIIRSVSQMNTDLNRSLTGAPKSGFPDDDIGEISLLVQKMIHDTQEYCAKIESYEAANLRMELELLQMRFNPHLLYNTLSALRYKIKDPEARDSIDSLCHYYRIVLNNGHLIIKLEDEIEMIKEFLAIEKFAYQLNFIDYQFQIDDQITQYAIIKHLLQPIVENALKHGLRPAGQNHKGILSIRAFPQDDCICICVTDNGVGMPPEKIEKLLSAPSASVLGHGYGVYNVQQRVQVYYGKEYGLQVHSTVGQGTSITLKIPAIPADEATEL